jgi:hypothetical protein
LKKRKVRVLKRKLRATSPGLSHSGMGMGNYP